MDGKVEGIDEKVIFYLFILIILLKIFKHINFFLYIR